MAIIYATNYAILFGNLNVRGKRFYDIIKTYNNRNLKETGSADVAEWSSLQENIIMRRP
jgi:hypothetical protein